MPIRSNIFLSKKELQQQNLTVDLYLIEGILRDNNHFRNLSKIIESISHQLGVLVIPYSPGEKDYINQNRMFHAKGCSTNSFDVLI